MSHTMAGERVAIFCMDPGWTTGLMWATVTLKGTTKEVFSRDKPEYGQIDCCNPRVDREETEQYGAMEVAALFAELQADWVLDGIPYTRQFFIYESFDLRPGGIGGTDRAGLAPVRVTSLIRGMLIASKHVWVANSASTAKSTMTNDRLRRAGLWAKAKPHARDAARQGAVWVRQNL